MGRIKFDAHDDAFLRMHYGQMTAREIAEYLDRPMVSVYARAKKLGLSRRMEEIKCHGLDDVIREHHPDGWSDAEIGEEAGCSREVARDRRQALGLPSNAFSDRRRQRVREKTRAQLERLGLKSLAELRVYVFRERAKAAGWPEDLRPRSVQILNLLWDNGPMTRREIAAGCGMPWKGSRKSLVSNDPEGSYLAHLQARGLVIVFKRAGTVRGQGKGRSVDVYSLPLNIERQPFEEIPNYGEDWKCHHENRCNAPSVDAEPANGNLAVGHG